MDDDPVAQFMAITDQSAAVASGCLSMTEGDVMAAVNMFFENPEIASSFPQNDSAAAAASSSSSRPQAATTASRNIGREDESGVIHIDDDDDDMVPHDQDDSLAEAERIAQENDDAAMARRIQEEMYGGSAPATDIEGVRAPIARTTETLVAPSGYGGMEDDYDMLDQLRRRNRPRRKFLGKS
jgi:hypothetical protein